MNKSALYHRPDSEFAYLYHSDTMRIRLRSAKSDIVTAAVIYGDPYLFDVEKWYQTQTPMIKKLSTDLHDFWEIEIQSQYSRVQYAFYLKSESGEEYFYGDQGVFPFEEKHFANPNYYFRMPYFQEIDRFKTPDWVKETVWYQIFPERFANGDPSNDPEGTLPWGSKAPGRDDFFGGDLQGVIDHLDYLVEFGITGIYFCPIFKATSNHKYDTIDYLEIDPAFGTKELFKELVDKAHQKGIRIMLDAVFNHMGDFSEQWQDIIAKGADSVYADWFHIKSFPITFEETDHPEIANNLSFDTFAFTPHMPKLNTANQAVQEYLLNIATYWIREFDIDAWRLDVANEVDHRFWKKFQTAVLNEKADCYILGEIWHSSQSWLQGDEFHAVMNYAFTDNIKDCLIHQKISPSEMVSGLVHQQMLYRDQVNEVTFNLLDSHDTARILTVCKEDTDLAKLVLTFMFLQKGSPCIYYGTEVGMTGEDDPDCRKCMVWEEEQQDLEMLAFSKALIQLRKEHSDEITYGETVFASVDDSNKRIIIERRWGNQVLTAYFNQSHEELVVTLQGNILLEQNSHVSENNRALLNKNGFIVTFQEM